MKLFAFEWKKLFRRRSVQAVFLISFLLCLAVLLLLHTKSMASRDAVLQQTLLMERNSLAQGESSCKAREEALENYAKGSFAREKAEKNLSYQKELLRLQRLQVHALEQNDVLAYLENLLQSRQFSLTASEEPTIQIAVSQKQLAEEVKEAERLLEQGIDPFQSVYAVTLWTALAVLPQTVLLFLFPLLCIVLCQTFCKEFSDGMAALLFSQPYGRTKGYSAKYLAVLLAALLFLLLMGGEAAVVGYALGGAGMPELPAAWKTGSDFSALSLPQMAFIGFSALFFCGIFLVSMGGLLSCYLTHRAGYPAVLGFLSCGSVLLCAFLMKRFPGGYFLFLGTAVLLSAVWLAIAGYRRRRLELL